MVVGEGTSGCRRVVPGTRFVLGDHDIGRLDREYVVTEVKHQGCAPGLVKAGVAVYENTFKCAPSTVVARPRRPARSVQQVTETAVVVGPQGQEIHTDEHGRVKVQFHRDREGKHNENSSCWIRVAQTWAGSGWGFQFIPRVGKAEARRPSAQRVVRGRFNDSLPETAERASDRCLDLSCTCTWSAATTNCRRCRQSRGRNHHES